MQSEVVKPRFPHPKDFTYTIRRGLPILQRAGGYKNPIFQEGTEIDFKKYTAIVGQVESMWIYRMQGDVLIEADIVCEKNSDAENYSFYQKVKGGITLGGEVDTRDKNY